MKLWWRRIAVVFITILTLGIYSPTNLLEVDADKRSDSNISSSSDIETASVLKETTQSYIVEDARQAYLKHLQKEAKALSLEKFGPKITDKVEGEFAAVIFPQMETMLADLVEHAEAYQDIAITEKPSKGYGERMFNVSNSHSGETLVKFHVRRENRPLEGHYFHFHYHLNADGFQKHYPIGDIYWDRNTPPKWKA
ncbi:YpjP family protein [Oceanobacillus locisalsi]|uniref:YpjP family protein n=1 Tax=Oceanobacillus locisalsi TaxID=546107 RepID=A0ABW3NAN8_9BACI